MFPAQDKNVMCYRFVSSLCLPSFFQAEREGVDGRRFSFQVGVACIACFFVVFFSFLGAKSTLGFYDFFVLM